MPKTENNLKILFLPIFLAVLGLGFFCGTIEVNAAEFLGRSLFCLPKDGKAYCSWRLLPTDASNIGFHVYRSGLTAGPFTKLTSSPVTSTTDFLDSSAQSGTAYYYLIKTVDAGGAEGVSSNLSRVTAGATKNYIDLPLFSGDETITATAVADVNADGVFDFIFHSPNTSGDDCDRSHKPTTTSTKLGVLMSKDGFWEREWEVDTGYFNCVGPTYPELNHYAGPLLAWDLDGDQKAEIVTRWGASGETLAIVDGETGAIKASTAWPPAIIYYGDERSAANIVRLEDVNGDGSADPFIVIQNGLYGANQSFTIFYYNPQTEQIEKIREKIFTSGGARGTHGLVSADIDGDGKDEIIPCGTIIDDDLDVIKQINTQQNDVCYVGDIRPDIDGMESWMGPEFNKIASLVDVRGNILWTKSADATFSDADGWEQGWCAEVTAKYDGLECFAYENRDGSPSAMYNARLFAASGADITTEFISLPHNARAAQSQAPVDWEKGDGIKELYQYGAPPGVGGAGWYYTVRGDIMGDAREEVIGYAFSKQWYNASGILRININNKPNSIRHVTPLSDRNYRAGLARSGVGYTYNNIPSVSGVLRDDVIYPSLFLPADVNNDGFVNSQDITLCVNVILGTETTPVIIAKAKAITVPLDACDVLDLQMIVNEILK